MNDVIYCINNTVATRGYIEKSVPHISTCEPPYMWLDASMLPQSYIPVFFFLVFSTETVSLFNNGIQAKWSSDKRVVP